MSIVTHYKGAVQHRIQEIMLCNMSFLCRFLKVVTEEAVRMSDGKLIARQQQTLEQLLN